MWRTRLGPGWQRGPDNPDAERRELVIEFFDYLSGAYGRLLEQAVDHARVAGFGLLLATAISLVLAVVAHRIRMLSGAILAIESVLLTVPSLALFAIFIALGGGVGEAPIILALTLYGLLPITRNALVGLRGVDAAIVESSKGMGLTATQRLLRIELPLAWPVVLVGVRVAAVLLIGITAIGATLGGPGLGIEINSGIRSLGGAGALERVVGGTVATAALALLVDAGFRLLSRFTTSKGIA